MAYGYVFIVFRFYSMIQCEHNIDKENISLNLYPQPIKIDNIFMLGILRKGIIK
jgi:hypothetical protein